MQTQNPIMDVEKIRQILPHRYPMLLVDRVVELVRNSNDTKPDGYIKAYKKVTINEEVFLGHFQASPFIRVLCRLREWLKRVGCSHL